MLRDGKPIHATAALERLTSEDVLEAARQHEIDDLASVEIGILEPDGKFSFITRDRR